MRRGRGLYREVATAAGVKIERDEVLDRKVDSERDLAATIRSFVDQLPHVRPLQPTGGARPNLA